MSKTIAVHLRYKSLYISLPSSTKLEREMTKFYVVYRTWTATANFSYFNLELNAVVAQLACLSSHWRNRADLENRKFVCVIKW